MTEGTLTIKTKNRRGRKIKETIINFISKNGQYIEKKIDNIPEYEISLILSEKIKSDETQKIEVEFEEEGDQLKKIREKGTQWDRVEEKLTVRENDTIATPFATRNNTTIKGNFHNPYNFIPTPSRNNDNQKLEELGDRPPAGHSSYRHDYWSGRISVSLTTETPLLIPDAANLEEKQQGHKVYDIRLNADGKPNLPITSVKGMLRSAFEIITNSRYCIFEKHKDRLAYRTPPEIAVLPARVESKDNQLYLRIMDDNNLVGKTAKLERYQPKSRNRDKGESRVATKYQGLNQKPQHGDAVWVKLNKGKVEKIIPRTQAPSDNSWKKGWVCVTGANIGNKKNERVFIENNNVKLIPITPKIKSLWEELIKNYQQIHIKDLEKRKQNRQSYTDYLGDKPSDTGWSRHIWNQNDLEFKEGTLCYVEFQNNQITAIQPVTISRRLYSVPPADLLPESLQPAKDINELSPADRVFGWVNQNGKGSYKGNLRIFNLNCLTENSIERFNDENNPDGFPLTILGQPQPQQARFYQAKDKEGNPLQADIAKKEGYSSEKQGLRGRKVYPHHQGLPVGYWDNPNQDRTTIRPENDSNYCQEYRQPRGENEKTDQNRSIKAWVKPQVEFKFTLDIINLSSVELGALLWLHSLPKNHYHRLGGGKPLGFGSISLKINWEKTDLRNGQDWQQYYSSLLPIDSPQSCDRVAPFHDRQFFIDNDNSCVKQFENAVASAYGNGSNFEQVSFIKAFLRYTQGFDDNLPIYYPRLQAQREADAEGFKWFEENERTGDNGGYKLPLPILVSDRGLPFVPSLAKK